MEGQNESKIENANRFDIELGIVNFIGKNVLINNIHSFSFQTWNFF